MLTLLLNYPISFGLSFLAITVITGEIVILCLKDLSNNITPELVIHYLNKLPDEYHNLKSLTILIAKHMEQDSTQAIQTIKDCCGVHFLVIVSDI